MFVISGSVDIIIDTKGRVFHALTYMYWGI